MNVEVVVQVRAARVEDARGMACVKVDAWRSAYAGIVPADVLASLNVEAETARFARWLGEGSRYHVAALEDATVVGYANGGVERTGDPSYRGELYSVYLLPLFRRKGLGRTLVGRVAKQLSGEGLTSMLAWSLAGNLQAKTFYERMGAREVRRGTLTIGVELEEVAYGWADTAALLR